MDSKTKYFFNNKNIPFKFSAFYVLTGIVGILSLDKLIKVFIEFNETKDQSILTFGILFLITTGVILFIILNHMQKVIRRIDASYNELKEKDKQRLLPYEFALNNSIDAIYWFTLDAKFIYVNDAACNMLGYTQEEFLSMKLEDMDPQFNRKTAIECMHSINNSKDWRLETTQKKKDNSIFPVEVSGHGFKHNGKDYICAFGRDMTQRQEFRDSITSMNRQLQKSNDEKEILLKEIHHRVKNNMEIISSLLSMQVRRTDDSELKYAMKQSMSRIHTMALVHEFLYLGKNLAYINVPDYVTKLVDDIKDLYISQNTKLEVELYIDKLDLSTDRCIQLGMVLHELCVNAFKYAFGENRDNLLCVHMKIKNDIVLLKIRDNGDGMENIDSLYKSESIGMQLIHSIVEDQLDGEIEFQNNKGLECNIKFPQKESDNE